MNIDHIQALARITKGKRAKNIPTFNLPFLLAQHSECGCREPGVVRIYLRYPTSERSRKATDPETGRERPAIRPPASFQVKIAGRQIVHLRCGGNILADNSDQALCRWLGLSPEERAEESRLLGPAADRLGPGGP